jgi:membrane protein
MRLDLRAFRYLFKGRFWAGLWDKINEDDCWGMAAQLSFYFLLALFPFLIFLSALLSYIPVDSTLVRDFLDVLETLLPERSFVLVESVVLSLIGSRDQGVITLGLLTALWFGSLGFNGMINLLNRANRVRETRSYFKTRSLAILVTIVVSIFLIASWILLFFGDWLIRTVFQGYASGFLFVLGRWTMIFLLLSVGIQSIYFALPVRRLPFRLISPGGIIAVIGWLIGSIAYREYVNDYGQYQRLYGSLGALIGLMIWFYLCSFCLLLGGEIDSEIYRMRDESRGVPGADT